MEHLGLDATRASNDWLMKDVYPRMAAGKKHVKHAELRLEDSWMILDHNVERTWDDYMKWNHEGWRCMEQWETWRTRRSEKPLLLQKKTKKNTSSGSIKERFPHVTCQGAESANDLLMSKVGGSTNLWPICLEMNVIRAAWTTGATLIMMHKQLLFWQA